jgi:hypothetical protein
MTTEIKYNENPKQYMNNYMKKYLKNYNNIERYCDICEKVVKQGQLYNHRKSKIHMLKQTIQELQN